VRSRACRGAEISAVTKPASPRKHELVAMAVADRPVLASTIYVRVEEYIHLSLSESQSEMPIGGNVEENEMK
jgi:hypothetical protein